MCLWILTACLGLLPGNPSPIIVAPGAPSPIIIPTVAPTLTPTFPGNIISVPTILPITLAPTAVPTLPPTNMLPTIRPPVTMPPTVMPPLTMPPTFISPVTMPPTVMPPLNMPPTIMPLMTLPPTIMPPLTMPPTIMPLMTMPPTTMPSRTNSTTMTAAPYFNFPSSSVMTIQTTIGPILIDPRVGSTAVPSAALNRPPITGYNAQVSSFNTAVNFPRTRRNVDPKYIMNINYYLNNNQNPEGGHNIKKRQSCVCVPAGTCVRNVGASLIDVRIVTPTQCPAGQEYCCSGTTNPVTPINCGLTQSVPPTAVAPTSGQANYGEFPWQAIILTRQNDYIAGGVLIDGLNVLTVTHRMIPYVVSGTAPNVKVRLGEWDAAGTYEPIPYQEYTVTRVFSHPMYNANTLQYDITILRLASSVPFTPNVGAAVTINRACLPPSAATAYTGQRCMVSGWGKNMFGVQGLYQQILKKVDVPIVAPATCQAQLQAARLGASYMLDTTSFICAGGEANKDSCTGDGGSGLVCQVNGQWVVVGLVAWGLGCASTNVPGVYVNVAALLPWIQQQIATP